MTDTANVPAVYHPQDETNQFEVIVELKTVYPSLEAAYQAYHDQYTGAGTHTVRLADTAGNLFAGPKNFNTFTDVHGSRNITDLCREK